MLLKHNRVDGKYKMLTRPRKHVKSHLNFQRLKSKQFIPVFVLNAWYLFLYFQPTWKTVMLCGLKMLSRFQYPIYMCSYFQEKNHICRCPQKVSDKWGPTARDQVVKSAWEQRFALAKNFLPGGCKMYTALKENTHCFMPLCGFQVQTLLKKCEHQMCCLNVFKTWLVKA